MSRSTPHYPDRIHGSRELRVGAVPQVRNESGPRTREPLQAARVPEMVDQCDRHHWLTGTQCDRARGHAGRHHGITDWGQEMTWLGLRQKERRLSQLGVASRLREVARAEGWDDLVLDVDPSGYVRGDHEHRTVRAYRPRWWESLWWPLKRQVEDVRFFFRITLPEFFIRGRRGWAPSDTWNLDRYLSRIMGESLARFAESNHGWPGEGSDWPRFEDWQAEIRIQAAALLAYASEESSWSDGWRERGEANAKAIARLSEYWGALWD